MADKHMNYQKIRELLDNIINNEEKFFEIKSRVDRKIDTPIFYVYLSLIVAYIALGIYFLDIKSAGESFDLYSQRCNIGYFWAVVLAALYLILALLCGFIIITDVYNEKSPKDDDEVLYIFWVSATFVFAIILYKGQCMGNEYENIFISFFRFLIYMIPMYLCSAILNLCGFFVLYALSYSTRVILIFLFVSSDKKKLHELGMALDKDEDDLKVLVIPMVQSVLNSMGGGSLQEIYDEVNSTAFFIPRQLLEQILQSHEDVETITLGEEVFYKSKLVAGGSNMKTIILND